jgi:hypothetical protein
MHKNPQGTKENVRSSWADSIAGNEYVPTFNRLAVDINSYKKKLVSGVICGKSMHTEYFSSPKLKPATGQSNEKLSACVSPKLKQHGHTPAHCDKVSARALNFHGPKETYLSLPTHARMPSKQVLMMIY